MDTTASKLIAFYKGQTDGFPHVKKNRWEDNHLIVWLDHDYVDELCAILPYSYFDRQIKCYLCYDGNICIPEFEEIFEYFGINAEDIEPKTEE